MRDKVCIKKMNVRNNALSFSGRDGGVNELSNRANFDSRCQWSVCHITVEGSSAIHLSKKPHMSGYPTHFVRYGMFL